jgi:2-methylcitrate dehydratase PrpD
MRASFLSIHHSRRSLIKPIRPLHAFETDRSRRSLLLSAGSAALAAALPSRAFAAAPPSATMTALSTYMAAAAGRALPDDVLEKAKHHILDTFASMVSGAELAPAKAAFNYAKDIAGDRTATIVATKMTAHPMEAAFVNAMTAQADETDDSNEFAQWHPGCAVVPPAFAAGEKFGVDGMRLIRAVTLGYDIGSRMTISFGAIDYRNNSHKSTHAIAGVFGAGAASGSLAGFDAQRMRWLLDYTAQQSSGIGAWTRDTEHMEKSFVFAAMPARNGISSALMVNAGFTGIDDIFSGVDNYFLAYAPNADQKLLIDQLGSRFEIARTNIKKWSVGSPIQAPLDALENVMKKRPIAPERVKSVVVRLAHTEARVVDNREMPDICVQHLVAVMLIDGTVSFRAAHDVARMKDPAVLSMRAKVQLIPSDELERAEPERQGIVEVTLDDGTVVSDYVHHVRGAAGNPMDRADVTRKSRDLMEPLLGKSKAARLIDQLLALDTLADVRSLRPLLQPD